MHEDDLLTYPTEKVVGIAADRDTLDAVRDALEEGGVGEDRVEVYCGEQGSEKVDPHADSRGPLARAVTVVQKALGEEAVRLEKLNAAIEAGQYVVQVGLSEEDDDARERQKQEIGRMMATAGAAKVAFYGKWQVEQLQLGA